MPEANRDELDRIRHSTAHVMAEAVLALFPGTKIAIGPPIEDGFYYDFDLPRPLKEEDLPRIEERMRQIIAGDHAFRCEAVSREQARRQFQDQPYKLELIEELPEGERITVYTQNTFSDLCRGPHVERTGQIRPDAFKLLSVAGAYWRGDERKPMLTRIYGTAWKSRQDLEAYLKRLAEIERRDHRRLGKELDLFSTHEEAGPGLIYWHPNGARIRAIVEQFWREEHFRNGYDIVYSPHIGKAWLWKTSGHLENYADIMYAPLSIDNQDYYLKPMNCPFHILMYKNRLRSYRELPLRWAELGTVYRYERSGVLHGLLRVRGFTQDDAHIFCTPEQIDGEILKVLRFSMHMWRSFGFTDIKPYLATRPPEKSIGEEANWEKATSSLRQALEAEGLEYVLDEGGGAFYGPKIDLKIRDALGREWQMTTIQFDFNEPERFDMTYMAADGTQKRPYMVHRALLGSLERFFGVLTEHYGGAFPYWLAPVQAQVIPVAAAFDGYAQQVVERLRGRGVRAEADLSDNRLNAKIRAAQNLKIPYMIVVGEREASGGTLSVRTREGEQSGGVSLDEFLARIRQAEPQPGK